jgi:hypothetical protein
MNKKAIRLRIAAVPLAALLGMFASVTPALAATTGIAQASSPSTATRTYSAVSGAKTPVIPDIQVQSCTSGRAQWVHMVLSYGTGLETRCYGYTGIEYFSGNVTWHVCAGNNYGSIYYYDPHQNKYETWDFAPGHVIAWTYGVDISWLHISGYGGGDTC